MKQEKEPTSSDLSSTDAAELARLREFVAEYRRMIRQYDRSLPRWRHYQTEWLWLYLRGMVDGATPLAVKQRRLDELEVDRIRNEERVALERDVRAARNRVVRYAKIEMVGGPADGQTQFVCLPIAEARTAISTSRDGEVIRSLYHRPAGEIGDLAAFRVLSLEISIPEAELERAFRGKRSTRFFYCPPSLYD